MLEEEVIEDFHNARYHKDVGFSMIIIYIILFLIGLFCFGIIVFISKPDIEITLDTLREL